MFVDIRTADKVIDVTLTVDTGGAYSAGEVVCDTAEIAGVLTSRSGRAILQSLTVIDKSDQKAALSLIFLKSNVSLGTKNDTPNVSDSNAGSAVIGVVPVAAADYVDLGGVAAATVRNIGLILQPDHPDTGLYVSAITSGTPTYGAASDLSLKLGFLRTEGYS